MATSRLPVAVATAVSVSLLCAGCTDEPEGEQHARPSQDPSTVTLVTHDEFVLGDGVLERFEKESGLTVEVKPVGSAARLRNLLQRQTDAPIGDVVFGVDSLFESRITEAGVTEVNYLWPVGESDVCVTADTDWFAEQDVPVPGSLDDLADPRYQGLLVTPDPATSAIGLAFLLAGVDEYGDTGVTDYFAALRGNDIAVAPTREEAYGAFTGAGGGGDRPLVVSPATALAATTDDGGTPGTAVVAQTCFRVEENAGVLAGARNRQGAKDLLEFLVSDEVQEDVPRSMALYPADEGTRLPAALVERAPLVKEPHELDPDEIAEHREGWIRAWAAIVAG